MNIVNQLNIKHYSIIIYGNASNGSFPLNSNYSYYLFNILDMNDWITSNESLVIKVDHINTINTKEDSIIIENGYSRLTEIIAILNHLKTHNLNYHHLLIQYNVFFIRVSYDIEFF